MTQSKMSMISHDLHRCCCEFSRPFKRRVRWQADQDTTDSHCPLSKDKNPLDELRRSAVHPFSWLGVLVRRVLAIPATSEAPKRLFKFSMAGNVITKKRPLLTFDNMEELVYLHEVWPQVRGGWEAVKKMRLARFFWINETHCLQCLLLSLVFWLWDSIWIILTLTLARCFSSLFPSLHTYTYTYYYCILYFLVLTKPAPAWVPFKSSVTQSWHFTDTCPRTGLYRGYRDSARLLGELC